MAEAVVVIEDEPDILEVIVYNLTREKFRVLSARDGEAGFHLIGEALPDLVLLDLMLPGMDGLDVCRQLKADPHTRRIPIIMVTAKGEERDVVTGLDAGADDYITKPFGPKALVARVRAVLRRGRAPVDGSDGERLVRDGIVIDKGRHEVLVNNHPVVFTATELRLLHYLAIHPGRVFTRDQLVNQVMSDDTLVLDRNIDVHVGAIRKKLGPYRDLIQTIRAVGYRFRDSQE